MPSNSSVIIIDDEAFLRSTLSKILEKAGYSVAAAGGADEAIEILHRRSFDLAFLDLKMPGKDGLELLPEIRYIDPFLPVLILTANASLASAIQSMRLGAAGYLMKPIDPEQLLDQIEVTIKDWKERRGRERPSDRTNKTGGIYSNGGIK